MVHESATERPDTVDQPCEGENVALLLVGQSTGPSTTVFSLQAVRDELHHVCRRQSRCSACTDAGDLAEKVKRHCR
jgi:hypothetical protein